VSEAAATVISESMKQTSLVIIICLLLAQFVGKSILKKIWNCFLLLQLVMVIVQNNRQSYPANVLMVIDGLSGTLELNALPKDDIKKFVLSSASETIMPKDGILE